MIKTLMLVLLTSSPSVDKVPDILICESETVYSFDIQLLVNSGHYMFSDPKTGGIRFIKFEDCLYYPAPEPLPEEHKEVM